MSIDRNKEAKVYLIFFDYLRVFAILGVLAVHLAQNFPFPKMLNEVMWQGAACVQVFFVMSAYLACAYFFRPDASIIGYYKNRALRILPIYYTAIVLAMVYMELFCGGTSNDCFGLGWLRYFLGVNTILPSNNFAHWNNCFGFWAMGSFLPFYLILPFVLKVVNSFWKSVCFFVVCFGLFMVLRRNGVEILSLDGYSLPFAYIVVSPFTQMQYFALGIVAFFAIRENKQSLAIIISLLFALLPHRIGEHYLLFAIASTVAILSVKNEAVMLRGTGLKVLKFLAKYSFHIYLTNLMAFSVAEAIACSCCDFQQSVAFYSFKFILSIGLIVILSMMLEFVNRLVQRVFLKNRA